AYAGEPTIPMPRATLRAPTIVNIPKRGSANDFIRISQYRRPGVGLIAGALRLRVKFLLPSTPQVRAVSPAWPLRQPDRLLRALNLRKRFDECSPRSQAVVFPSPHHGAG